MTGRKQVSRSAGQAVRVELANTENYPENRATERGQRHRIKDNEPNKSRETRRRKC